MQFRPRSFCKIFLILLSYQANCATSTAYPFCTPNVTQQTQQALGRIYAPSQHPLPTTLPKRIQYFSGLFLEKPYALTALGEGAHGQFDQAPLYRFDAFDCQTYVETVLALTLADSPTNFKRCINHIRYANGKIDYIQRHHFTSPDWNQFNQQQGLLKDITTSIVDQNHHPIARYADAEIAVSNWYRHFDLAKIRICHASKSFAKQQLDLLKQRAKNLPNKRSRLAYIPIETLVSKDKSSRYILDQIPNGAILEIVRPNWDLTQAIGTHLNVSHLGWAIREHGEVYFYQASSLSSNIVKSPLIDYLIRMQSQPTIKGINVQIVLPSHLCRQ